jgi:hypothetical protein
VEAWIIRSLAIPFVSEFRGTDEEFQGEISVHPSDDASLSLLQIKISWCSDDSHGKRAGIEHVEEEISKTEKLSHNGDPEDAISMYTCS